MNRSFACSSLLYVLTIAACAGDKQSGADSTGAKAGAASVTTASSGDLTGAGSTFANPLYSRWSSDYAAKTNVHVNYQPIGSGGGIRQFSEMTVDFGGTDSPMTDAQLSTAKGGPVLHVPTALGATVITYNLDGVAQPLRLTGTAIADIFLGKITKWNDGRIAALNPGVTLPPSDIVVVHRSDGSGTTFMFTDFLTATSPDWAKTVGKGSDVKWPVGLGGKGSDGVSGQVRQTAGAIGYVELSYAKQNKMAVALVKNAAGAYVDPTVESITAAAAGVSAKLAPNTDYRVSIVNAPGAAAYPISSFTWILVYKNQRNATKGKELVDFLRWGLSDGQAVEPSLDYAPLPTALLPGLRQKLDSIKIGSQ